MLAYSEGLNKVDYACLLWYSINQILAGSPYYD